MIAELEEGKVACIIVVYERYEDEDTPRYEYMHHRGRFLSYENYERKMTSDLEFAARQASDNCSGVIVVAYVACDGATSYEDNSYAVVAVERMFGRSTTWYIGEEIAEEIQLW